MMHSAEAPADGIRSAGGEIEEESAWLMKARDAFETSTSYYDTEVRKPIEKAVSHFQGKHSAGSKYKSAAYKFRAKGFRPKTRAIIRRNEAAAATAIFSTSDVVDIKPRKERDEAQKVSAEILMELMDHHLTNSIPWFKLSMAAYQDALTTGAVISHQHWRFDEQHIPTPLVDPETGEEVLDEEGEPVAQWNSKVLADHFNVELRPVENIRFSPAADWADPLNDSPYLIDRFPMHVGEVKERMNPGGKGRAAWHKLADSELQQGSVNGSDDKASRDRTKIDKTDSRHSTSDFDTVWVHRNIVRESNRDWLFYTLGTHYLLSDPVPLEDEYFHIQPGERPYVMGVSIIEAHKAYASGLGELLGNLQQEANEINNQRRDNVALVLNRRYYARRGAVIDYKSLSRNVPGSVTLMDDINNDIRSDAPPEVTGSSYQEQDRLNMDYDELAGAFSTSSVGTNRQLNETVGGMSMLSEGANALMEYQLRTFVETWMEPVLRQLIQLIQAYETDEVLLGAVGEKLQLFQRYKVDQITDRMLQGSMSVKVNVGFGATNPQKRIEKLAMGLQTVGNFIPNAMARLQEEEVIKEVFGALGYKASGRFFPEGNEGEDPRMQQMQQQMQQMQQMLEGKQMEQQAKMQVEQAKIQQQATKAQMDSEIAQARLMQERELRMMEMALKRSMTMAQLQAKLQVDSQNAQMKQVDMAQKAGAEKQKTGLKMMEQNTKRIGAQTDRQEMNYKERTGMPGR
jgi:hypothetical protein